MTDYYQILGISKQANIREIKSAFKKLALQYHPDRNPGNKEAEETFKQINEAYQVLSDSHDKLMYDLKLNGHYTQPSYSQTYTQTEYRQTYTQPRSSYQPPYAYTPVQARRAYIFGTGIILILALFGYFLYTYMNHRTARTRYAEALVYIERNQIYGALSKLDEALYFDNEYAEAYLKRGKLQLTVGRDYMYAYADFNSAIQYADTPEPEMYFFRALSLFEMGEYQKVIQDCKQVVEEQNLKGPAIFLQAAAKKALHDNNGACQDWKQAYSLGLEDSADSLRIHCSGIK